MSVMIVKHDLTFVTPWIYLYTGVLAKSMVTGITAYKRRSLMYRIIKIGMDVHSKNYTLCAMEPVIGAEDRIFANIKVTADYKNVLMFIENLKLKLGIKRYLRHRMWL